MACDASSPHMSSDGRRPPQKAGRSGWPKILQRWSSSNCTHLTPAGLPPGMPGIGLVIDGAMQQAPQPERQGRFGVRGARAGDVMVRLSAQVARQGEAA